MSTEQGKYTERLVAKENAWWRRLFNVQAPYRLHLQSLKLGSALDIGCGVGRNLRHLGRASVGIDHNARSVETARSRGLTAFTPDQFQNSPFNVVQGFDSFLLSHVAEHMSQKQAVELIKKYLFLLKPHGRLVMITPQEAGYRSDATHVEFMDFTKLRQIARETGFTVLKEYSFPLPRPFGHLFYFNEFVSINANTETL